MNEKVLEEGGVGAEYMTKRLSFEVGRESREFGGIHDLQVFALVRRGGDAAKRVFLFNLFNTK